MNRKLYWVAIRGAAVPSWPLPVDEGTMRGAVVVVGAPPEPTLWLFSDVLSDPIAIGPSNYDYLIGYQSLAAQQAGIAKLLHGSIDDARAELSRARREETVILGRAYQ